MESLTSRQTPAELKNTYGLGFSVTEHGFGHAGACSTNTVVETGKGLILVWLVQHAGFPGKGAKAQAAFREAALARF